MSTFTPSPEDIELAKEVWARYRYLRDSGHKDFVEKADTCQRFFRGDQWEESVRQALKAQGRPALTINMIMRTLKTVIGQHILNRAELSCLPVTHRSDDVANALTKVLKHISRSNQLDWLTTELVQSGLLTSRGFLDVRLDYSDSMQGEVQITKLNPKNVLVDPDATDYDPDTWSDVTVSKWLSYKELANLYGEDISKYIKARGASNVYAATDNSMLARDRMSGQKFSVFNPAEGLGEHADRYVRVLERQYWENVRREVFVDLQTGDVRPVPTTWDSNRIAAHLQQKPNLTTTKRMAKRIKWVHCADDVILHNDWSPFEHYTVVPYFPIFDSGHTIGLVEQLLGPQELLNKSTSQELHVINTTANSGWIFKSGTLVNMDRSDLEAEGAKTGLVIEVSEDVGNAIEKISPNPYPSGLDRISFKADQFIKDISNVSDSMMGQDREDVAAKAINLKSQKSNESFALEFDNLSRTLYILGRNIVDIVQKFYTEPRMIPMVMDELTQDVEFLPVNTPRGMMPGQEMPQEEGGEGVLDEQDLAEIVNDLSMGEYRVVVTMAPSRDVMEDSEFEQAARLKELGLPIPDDVLIRNSRLRDRAELIKRMQQQAQSPEAQQQAQLQNELLRAEVDKLKAEVQRILAEAQHKGAKAAGEGAKVQQNAAKLELDAEAADRDGNGIPDALEAQTAAQRSQMELQMQAQQFEQEQAQRQQQFEQEMAQSAEQHRQRMEQGQQQLELDRQRAEQQREHAEAAAKQKARTQSNNPVKSK